MDKISHNSPKMEGFLNALSSDINVGNGITEMLEIIKKSNALLRQNVENFSEIVENFSALTDISYILGLSFKPVKFNDDEIKLYKEYEEAKKAKNYELSDELRKKLIAINIL